MGTSNGYPHGDMNNRGSCHMVSRDMSCGCLKALAGRTNSLRPHSREQKALKLWPWWGRSLWQSRLQGPALGAALHGAVLEGLGGGPTPQFGALLIPLAEHLPPLPTACCQVTQPASKMPWDS